jgi:hypothetical protein
MNDHSQKLGRIFNGSALPQFLFILSDTEPKNPHFIPPFFNTSGG